MRTFDISLNDIEVTLPNGQSLFKIKNFSVPFGRHILIQGESGKGKTTLLHLIAGLFTAQKGTVTLGSIQMDRLGDSERCDLRRENLGVIFQKLNLLDHLTAEENILLSASHAADSLKRVRLETKAQTRCSFLSLGEQQRVAVARVLAQSPSVILADEPTSSLDEHNTHFVMEALKETAQNKTLIVVSHDHRISSYFDEVIPFEEIIK